MKSIVDSDSKEKSCFLRKAEVLKILRKAAGEIPSEWKTKGKKEVKFWLVSVEDL